MLSCMDRSRPELESRLALGFFTCSSDVTEHAVNVFLYFLLYLGAACLALNVVENQTILGRLWRPDMNLENSAGHARRIADQKLRRKPALPFDSLQAFTAFVYLANLS